MCFSLSSALFCINVAALVLEVSADAPGNIILAQSHMTKGKGLKNACLLGREALIKRGFMKEWKMKSKKWYGVSEHTVSVAWWCFR